MTDLVLIGIGTGNPDHVTMQGAQAIRAADLILIPRKGANKADLAGVREEIIRKVTDTPPQIELVELPSHQTKKTLEDNSELKEKPRDGFRTTFN